MRPGMKPSPSPFLNSAQLRQAWSSSSPRASVCAVRRQWASTSSSVAPVTPSSTTAQQPVPEKPALAVLDWWTLLRSYAILSVSSSPLLLTPSLAVMRHMASSKSLITSPERNPLLGWAVNKTMYAQFCAGATAAEIQRTAQRLRAMGYKGAMLNYAREVVIGIDQAEGANNNKDAAQSLALKQVQDWRDAVLKTIEMGQPDDFVAVKFTGAGSLAIDHLAANLPPPASIEQAMTSMCDLAKQRGVRITFDAEQYALQPGIDSWTMLFQQRYNTHAVTSPGKAVVYGTYQSYLKSTPATLSTHLALARQNGFTLGVKLVRGAYLGTDARSLIWDTKPDTDKAYDTLAESLIRREYNDMVVAPSQGSKEFPYVCAVLASHNRESMLKAQRIRTEQAQAGEERIDLVYAQLMGMADEVSCELLQRAAHAGEKDDVPAVLKYVTWGTTGECMKYLLRRAEENRDAVVRTKEGKNALGREIRRRLAASVGLA